MTELEKVIAERDEALAALRADLARKDRAIEAWREDLTNERAERDALAAKLAAAEARAGALEQERVAEWNRRREADGSRDAAFAACDAMRDERDALAGTLKYLRTQAKNGTLHPQVVIQNVDAALTTPAEETKG